jgi:hypothetical protein
MEYTKLKSLKATAQCLNLKTAKLQHLSNGNKRNQTQNYQRRQAASGLYARKCNDLITDEMLHLNCWSILSDLPLNWF